MSAILGHRDQYLCVVETTVDLLEPKQYTHWWPVRIEPRHLWEDLFGKPLYKEGLYTYSMKVAGFWQSFRLQQDGQTHAIHVDIDDIPKPKGLRKTTETRWRSGRWEKLTRKGWEIA